MIKAYTRSEPIQEEGGIYMPSVLAYEDAKINQLGGPKKAGVAGGVILTPFFGSRDTPDFPQAY